MVRWPCAAGRQISLGAPLEKSPAERPILKWDHLAYIFRPPKFLPHDFQPSNSVPCPKRKARGATLTPVNRCVMPITNEGSYEGQRIKKIRGRGAPKGPNRDTS